jgi:hypothetical protein
MQRDTYNLISNHEIAEVRQKVSNNQLALFSLRSFLAGDLISEFASGTIVEEPTYLTIQVGVGKHITLQPEFLQYINHSCDPNSFFNTTTMQLVAVKPIRPEDEIVFFYPSSELMMTQAFECYCGSASCIGLIKGAAYLAKEVKDRYLFTDFILSQADK